ncbi:PKD domain-containing protein [Roseibacillus persicicus]|uniref:PKD domain-containing protein n=1 Tax=Roseibacillus persicicus TaxID=454148 RepID=UPI00281062F5|nr:PKD domain-containing protein [Roseibacillus persicicus]MDQ8192434.1 PKD domain-containing protein [Roseibacillus persicicus]
MRLHSSQRWNTFGVVIPLLVVLALLALILQPEKDASSQKASPRSLSKSNSKTQSAEDPSLVELPSFEDIEKTSDSLNHWLAENTNKSLPSIEIVELARSRGEMMQILIPHQPESALSAMLPLQSYRDLPDEITSLIEAPFAAAGSVSVVPDCASLGGEPDYFGRWGNEDYRLFVPSTRQEMMSKDWLSLSGIRIGNLAALHPEPIWTLSEDEVEAAGDLFALEAPHSQGSTALVGGQFVVGSPSQMDELAEHMRKLENLPDPTLRPVLADGGNGNGEDEALLRDLDKEETSWTLTDKKVLFLNLKFADSADAGVTKSVIEGRLAACSTRTEEMSYGKTRFSLATVSDVLTLPGTAASYEAGDDILYSQMHDEALDLAVSAGLISGSETAEWTDEYDIIGIVFPHQSIGWSGRASLGGRRHWINGNASFGTYIHEFGHNYGLNHASRWVENIASQIPPTPPSESNLSNNSNTEPRHQEYGNWFDYMGGDGEFGVMGKNRLSWITDGKIADLTGDTMLDQTVRLYRFDETAADTKPTLGARVQMQSSETFWLSYRGNHAESIASEGVHVIWQFTNSRGRLLDMTEENSTYLDTLLPLGRTYTDPSNLVNITPLAKGGSGGDEWLDVRVITGVVGNTNPTLAVSSDRNTANPLEEISFTATGADADDDSLFYNWDFGDGRTESATGPTLTHQYLVGGTYTVTISALDGRGGFAEETLQIEVADPLLDLVSVTSGTTSKIQQVKYHNGRFLAITSSELLSSFDGINWKILPTPSEIGPHYGFEISNSGMTLVGYGYVNDAWQGQISESADGLSWTSANLPSGTEYLYGVCEGNGIKVAVGNKGTILRKLPGSPWESVASGGTLRLKKVYYDGVRFWALGDDNLILTSLDSATWTPPTAGTDGYSWSDYETGLVTDNQFFAAGDYGRLGVSTDGGESWTENLDSIADVFALAQLPSRVICFGNDHNSEANQTQAEVLYATVDGSNWSTLNLPTPFEVSEATYGAGRLVVVGSQGQIQTSSTFVPDNQAPSGSLTLPATITARADFSPTGSVIDADGDDLFYYWNLGEGWTEQGPHPTLRFPVGGSRTIELAVVDARGGVLQQTFAIEVADPLLEMARIDSSNGETFLATVCAGDQIIAISWGKLHTATIGNELVQTAGIYPVYPNDIASDGTSLVLVGQAYNNTLNDWGGGIATSTVANPTPLTVESIPADLRHLNAVATGNDIWVTVGDDGRLLSKQAAGSWTERSSGTAEDLNDLAFGAGLFLAVGDNETILTSANGSNWTSKPAPSNGSAQGVTYCGNGFCIADSRGLHFTVDGGTSWTSTTLSNFSYRTMVWTGEVILVTGRLYDFGVSSWVEHLFVSEDGEQWEVVSNDSLADVRAWEICGDTLFGVGAAGSIFLTDLSSTTTPGSVIATIVEADPNNSVRLSIQSQPGESFDIFRSESLLGGFGAVPYASSVPAAPSGETTEWTDPTPLPVRAFYQIERLEP